MSSHGPSHNFLTFRERLNQLSNRVKSLEKSKGEKDIKQNPKFHYLHYKRKRGYNPFKSFKLFVLKQGMTGQFCFPTECLYPETYTNHLNKLIGFSFTHHHFQSVRLAWRPKAGDKPLIEVFLYTYVKGDLEFWKIQDCHINRVYNFSLRQGPTCYAEVVDNETYERGVEVRELPMNTPYIGYVNFPYFADVGPPHPMFVYVSYSLK